MFERVTITVPGDLRKRMQATKEPVNWSAIATRAFEGKLAEIVAKKETKTMEDAVQLLRASRLASSHRDYADGVNRGRDFVTRETDWKFCDGLKLALGDWDESRWDDAGQNGGAGAALEGILRKVDPTRFRPVKVVRAFIVDHIGDHFPSTLHFVRGWCEGALACFREIEERASPGARNLARRSYQV